MNLTHPGVSHYLGTKSSHLSTLQSGWATWLQGCSPQGRLWWWFHSTVCLTALGSTDRGVDWWHRSCRLSTTYHERQPGSHACCTECKLFATICGCAICFWPTIFMPKVENFVSSWENINCHHRYTNLCVCLCVIYKSVTFRNAFSAVLRFLLVRIIVLPNNFWYYIRASDCCINLQS